MAAPIDALRMSSAFARPGMDTRVNFAVCAIKAIKIDATGKFADVVMFPDGNVETVLIGVGGGQGGGLHIPYSVDDVVVVAFPNGNADEGGVIVGGVWDPGQPPPEVVVDNPDDPAWVARAGRTLRLLASDDGGLVLEVEDGLVKLGAESATRGAARLQDTVEITFPPNTIHIPNPPTFTPPSIPNPVPITFSGVITSASGTVKVR